MCPCIGGNIRNKCLVLTHDPSHVLNILKGNSSRAFYRHSTNRFFGGHQVKVEILLAGPLSVGVFGYDVERCGRLQLKKTTLHYMFVYFLGNTSYCHTSCAYKTLVNIYSKWLETDLWFCKNISLSTLDGNRSLILKLLKMVYLNSYLRQK